MKAFGVSCSFVFAGTVLAGCLSGGRVEEGQPRMRKPLPAATKVYFVRPADRSDGAVRDRSVRAVSDAFEQAFAARGVACVPAAAAVVGAGGSAKPAEGVFAAAGTNGCDVVLSLSVNSWDYADAGFSGFGARDEVVLQAVLFNAKTERVLSRATVSAVNGFGRSVFGGGETAEENLLPAARAYVEKFFEERRAAEEERPK